MQISSRFTIALHIFTCVDVFKDDYKVTSDFLAGSINTNPVIIRKILTQNGDLFHFHESPNPACPVGRNIHALLDDKLKAIQGAMEDEMRKYTLLDLRSGMNDLLEKEQ